VKKSIRFSLSLFLSFFSLYVNAQIGDLHLSELAFCTPTTSKDVIGSVEQSYKECVTLYNDAINVNLSDQIRIERLITLFRIQYSAKEKLQGVWQRSDSTSKENAKRYFNEASAAYKELTDTINLTNPSFKSLKRALVIVEKSHQVIVLQKFGIQVLFGCVKENSVRLVQPKDFPSDIVINIDMIERFRKVWNESNAPMTYEQWEYKPAERNFFSSQKLADSYKNRFNEKKKEVDLNSSNDAIINQGSLVNNVSANLSGKDELTKDKTNQIIGSDNQGDKNTRAGSNKNRVANGPDHTYSIKGESQRLAINQNTQFEINSLISKERIKTLGVEYFTVQIAANRTRLVIDKLKKELYCSNYKIAENMEEGWYKYHVGKFTSIDSANKFLARECILRGFVSGYNSKGRVAIFSVKQPILASMDTSVYSIIYRVQIAASRQPISNEALAAIYNGFNPVNVKQEDGWYRYSIGDYIYMNEAKTTRDSCGIEDAFIMPYHNQKRIQWPRKDLMEMLTIKQNGNPIYVIQVAASRNPLSINIVRDIIKVDYPLTMKFEDGWYKYLISAYTSFSAAKKVASSIGVKGSFIATYKNGLRVKP